MNVFEQDRSYRRGLVLGLTMAEIVTLVIFCLLLAFGVVLFAILESERPVGAIEILRIDDGSCHRLHDFGSLERTIVNAMLAAPRRR